MPRRILFTDFDGTVTRHDFFRRVLDEVDLEVQGDPWGAFRAGTLSHFDALARIFKGIRVDEAVLERLIRSMEPDPDFREDLGRLRRAGWQVHIVSAGSDYYIRRTLHHLGIDFEIPVHSNPGRYSPAEGLVLERPTDPRIRCPQVGIDKAATLRAYRGAADRVVFAGDSNPDLEAAKIVGAHDRFARGRLAVALDDLGLCYRPFERWHDIACALLADGAPPATESDPGSRA